MVSTHEFKFNFNDYVSKNLWTKQHSYVQMKNAFALLDKTYFFLVFLLMAAMLWAQQLNYWIKQESK